MSTANPEVLRAIAAHVDRAPSVVRRTGGALGVAAAYLPGERIEGLRLCDNRLEVHVVMRWGVTADAVERDVISAVRATTWDPARVDVVIEDIDVPTAADVAPHE